MRVRICNCGQDEFHHKCSEFTPIKLSLGELCKLGQIFHASNRVNTLRHSDERIAEWLRDRISEIEPEQPKDLRPLTLEMTQQWRAEHEAKGLKVVSLEGNGRY